MKKTYLDATNGIYLFTNQLSQFNKNLFYETLVTNDKIVLTNSHFFDCIELSKNNLTPLFRLLEEDELSIFYDFIPFRYQKHKEDNIMIEIQFNKSIDLEQDLFNDERYISLNKKYKKLVDKKTKKIDYKLVDIDNLSDYICSIINDKELLQNIFKVNKPYHILSNVIQYYDYNVTAKDGIFFIETECNDSKQFSNILVSNFFAIIIRSYINLLSQIETEADSLILSNSNRILFEKLFSNKINKSTDYTNTLMTIEKMPDLASYFSKNNIDINSIFQLRKQSLNLRNFINGIEYTTDLEFYKEYRDRIDTQYEFLNGITYKMIRFALTSIFIPVGTTLDILGLTGVSEHVVNKIKPTVRLQDIFK